MHISLNEWSEPLIAKSRTTVVQVCQCRPCGEAFLARSRNEPEINAVFMLDENPNLLNELVSVNPDVLVLDTNVRGGGFDFAAEVKRQLEGVKIIFVAKRASDVSVKQALALGAAGFLLSREPFSVLIEHVKNVAAGGYGFSKDVARRLTYDMAHEQYELTSGTPFDSLTGLQMEIFRHLARGDSLKMVARKMNLTRKSVDGHKYRIMKKIGVQDRVLLSRLAIREGLIQA